LRLNSSNNLTTLPIDNARLGKDFNPTDITIEIWFKAVDIYAKTIGIIVGMAPYKIRKRAG
jgi:hypothetical protein